MPHDCHTSRPTDRRHSHTGAGMERLALVLSAIGGGIVVAVASPFVRIPAEIAERNLQADVINEDGGRFLTHADRALESELWSIGNTASARGALFSGPHVAARIKAVVDASVLLRNEVARCDQLRRRIAVSERWWRRAWRRLTHNRFPDFTYRTRAIEQVHEWRAVEFRNSSVPFKHALEVGLVDHGHTARVRSIDIIGRCPLPTYREARLGTYCCCESPSTNPEALRDTAAELVVAVADHDDLALVDRVRHRDSCVVLVVCPANQLQQAQNAQVRALDHPTMCHSLHPKEDRPRSAGPASLRGVSHHERARLHTGRLFSDRAGVTQRNARIGSWPRTEVCSPQAPRLARRARRCLSGLGPGLAYEASPSSLLLSAIARAFADAPSPAFGGLSAQCEHRLRRRRAA